MTSRVDSALNVQLVPQCYPGQADGGRIFVRTSWEDEIAGDLDLLSEILARATGGPILTPAEARAALDLPFIPGTDRLREPQAYAPGPGALPEPDDDD